MAKTRTKRPTKDYLAAAKRLAKIAPSLKKYKRRKTLTRYEKSAITRKEQKFAALSAGGASIFPVTKQQAKRFKTKLGKGITALRLRDLSSTAKIRIKKDIIVESNGRTWYYWPIDKATARDKKKLGKIAEEAFGNQLYPVDKIAKLAELAFNKIKPRGVALWTAMGRANAVYTDIQRFLAFLADKWQAGKYVEGEGFTDTDPGDWIKGIAILVHEKGTKK